MRVAIDRDADDCHQRHDHENHDCANQRLLFALVFRLGGLLLQTRFFLSPAFRTGTAFGVPLVVLGHDCPFWYARFRDRGIHDCSLSDSLIEDGENDRQSPGFLRFRQSAQAYYMCM